MIYLDNGATSFHKPETVYRAMRCALDNCANPGRGGYPAAMAAAKTVLRCRERAAGLFHCEPEQVVMTSNCTHGLNIAINTLVKPGSRVVISGFEHNAVTRPRPVPWRKWGFAYPKYRRHSPVDPKGLRRWCAAAKNLSPYPCPVC